jgi:hypothetical protein
MRRIQPPGFLAVVGARVGAKDYWLVTVIEWRADYLLVALEC